MSLAHAFTTAWKDLKTGATKVAAFITKNSSTIQNVVAEAGTIATTIDPALAPVVTEFDQLEEQVIGKVLELANDTANAPSLAALFGAAWPVILSLRMQLATHPAVVAAVAAPAAATPAAGASATT
ncbi:MAG TPA: hypothetical protein VHW24_02265 [Bryobacteraceae bacterium]|jgi:hypothetical protein|nr:hypothetical protein [Bryobacteraceae bacterium]